MAAAKKRKARKKSMGWRGQVVGVGALIMTIVFMPTTIMLAIGMLPTIAAAVIDSTKKGTKALTVGAMNLAGCTPFLIELWTKDHTSEYALTIITDPRTVIVIYCAAGIGYLIDWALSGIVASVMIQHGQLRQKDIRRLQAELVERWGIEVTGEVPLDPYGFPVDFSEPPRDEGEE